MYHILEITTVLNNSGFSIPHQHGARPESCKSKETPSASATAQASSLNSETIVFLVQLTNVEWNEVIVATSKAVGTSHA